VRKDERPKGPSVGRLKRRADFLRVAAARRKWAAPGLILQVSPQPEAAPDPSGAETIRPETDRADEIRVGFTASRKVGNAVRRNRARRRLKALAAEMIAANANHGLDLVLIARPATVDRPFDELRRDLQQSLQRTKALRKRDLH
jgi:ribonuclease P protein component